MKKNILLAVASLVVLGIAGIYLTQTTEPSEENLGRPLGVLRDLKNEVRYKYTRTFFWKDAQDGRKVYDGSQIFVGPKSSALLVFAENRKVRLNEETLLRLSQVEQNPALIALQINDGGFNLKSGKGQMDPLVLNLDDGQFKIISKDAYDIYVKKTDKKLALSVALGNLTLQNVSGKTDLATGTSITLEMAGTVNQGGVASKQIIAKELPSTSFNLLAPYDGEIVREQTQPVFFKWETTDASNLRLQYSSQPDFADGVTDLDVSSQQFFPIPLNTMKGDVFWRLVSIKDGVPAYSRASFFKVGQVESIRVQVSAPNYIRKGVWRVQTTILDDDKSNFDFQVSKSESFTPLQDGFMGKAPFTSLLDSPGDYLVRARKNFGNGLFSPWSAAQKVTIRDSLKAPVIEFTDRTEDRVGNVISEIKWYEVPFAKQYIVQSSNTTSFAAVMSQKTVMTVESAVQHSSPRKVYYRVIAVSEEGENSAPSNTLVSEGSTLLHEEEQKRLALEQSAKEADKQAKAAAPKTPDEYNSSLLLPLDGSVFYTNDSIRFEWEPVFKKPTVEISYVSDFSQDVIRITAEKDNFTKIRPLERVGRYYWRLSFEQTLGRTEYSKTQSFTISAALSTQIEKLTLKFVERNKWNLSLQIKDAKPEETFNMQVSMDSTFSRLEHEQTSRTKDVISLSKPGTYYVRARRAKGASEIQGWSNVMTQALRPPLTAPQLQNPQEILAGPDLAKVHLGWSDVKYATQYIVELNNTNTFGSILRSYRVPENTYDLMHSQRDASYIRVLAQSAEGELSPPSNIVKVKGFLPGPTIEKYEIAYANLDSKGSIDQLHILWTHRKNALKYVVEVSRNEKFDQVQKFETKNIEFFTPVKDIGWYYFKVTPISAMTDYFFAPTTVFAVEYKKIERLQLATVEEPANGAKFPYNNGKYFVVFKWGQTLGAGWYDFEIAQNSEFKESKLFKVEARQYRLPPEIKDGTWYYRLRGRNPNQASPWSPTKTFTLQK
ncbi:hypothetical protein ACLVWU_15210 [Bdellovibrio sp. HCB290]|uniref:hypothetical protein n=1 Tax=Bdellovibrio sp. HCB290 TaxID=3394356 RepID=UPI0039B4D819